MSPQTGTVSIDETQALPLMRAEHAQLMTLFGDYQRLAGNQGSAADRSALVSRIAGRVQAVATLERELILPLLEDADAAREAAHQLDQLLTHVERLAVRAPVDTGLDEHVALLARAFDAHTRFENEHVFPRLAGRDLASVGAALLQRRAELLRHEGAD